MVGGINATFWTRHGTSLSIKYEHNKKTPQKENGSLHSTMIHHRSIFLCAKQKLQWIEIVIIGFVDITCIAVIREWKQFKWFTQITQKTNFNRLKLEFCIKSTKTCSIGYITILKAHISTTLV